MDDEIVAMAVRRKFGKLDIEFNVTPLIRAAIRLRNARKMREGIDSECLFAMQDVVNAIEEIVDFEEADGSNDD